MIDIKKIDHVGIRVREKSRAIEFYKLLGFKLITDVGFEKGHPVIMEHASGVVLNLLGPTNDNRDENILMDVGARHAGYTHMALRVTSLSEAEEHFSQHGVEITARFSFKDLNAFFVRDPDRNVIEFDEYPNPDPATRHGGDADEGYDDHL